MTRKIMLVDDEEGVLELMAATLEDDRYRLLFARDGEEALRIARQERPALLFLDILMPKKDGYEVCRVLKSDPDTASIRVIMLTALAQEFDRRRAKEMGADDYFTKPFSPTALLAKVEQALAVG